MGVNLRRLLSGILAFTLLFAGAPSAAFATVFELDEDAISSPTNPGANDDYETTWREGWGNSLLPQFNIKIPSPLKTEPAIIGGYYYINRPGSAPETMHVGLWGDSYWAPISNDAVWTLYNDIASEIDYPGAIFDQTFVPPVIPSRPVEGPFVTYFQFVANNTINAAAGGFGYGVDVTPPRKVTGLTAIPGVGAVSPTGWLKQSRVILKWDDIVYDGLSGTGYFELFINGKPYPASATDAKSRRVYDLKEHYLGYGVSINTKREMVIEDLPPGEFTLQVRAVDRATNEGPLSDPVMLKVDPDFPTISMVTPEVDGERLGAMPTFRADVTDRGGVANVAFAVDGATVGNDAVAPYEFAADLSGMPDGSTHTVRVTATDVAGRTNFAEKTFVIDKKPTVALVTPAALNQSVAPLVPLKVSYTDKTGVSNVVFRVDGNVVAIVVPSSVASLEGMATVLHRASSGPHVFSVTVNNVTGGTVAVSGSFVVDAARLPLLTDYQVSPLPEGEFPIWYNTEYPAFSAISDDSITNPTEVLYSVDRSPEGVINPLTPNSYYASFRTEAGTTYFNGVIDQNGVYLSNAAGFDGALQFPGVTRPTEGIWFTHAAVRNASGQAGKTVSTVYGVDLTPPAKVSGVGAWATITTPVTGWLQQTRAIIKWDGSERDALSGTAAYNVYLDGERIGEGAETIGFQPGRAIMSLTLEDLAPGAHTVAIAAVDRAGNEGSLSDPVSVRVFSTPTVVITNPASVDATLPTPAPLRATVRDAAGIDTVEFLVDGVLVKTFTPAVPKPSVQVCAANIPLTGGSHTLVVRATSVSGPVTLASRTFKVDVSLPVEVDPNPGGGGDGDGDGDGDGPTVTPAFTWFNTAYPTFSAMPSDVPTDPTELLYVVDRSLVTPIDPAMPNLYDVFFNVTGTTYFNGVIDQTGVYLSDPNAFDGSIQMPGRVTSPIEGIWYIHALARNALGDGSPLTHVAYGVDVTKPAQVDGVGVYANSSTSIPAPGILTQSRAVIRWSGLERDSLSGTEYFKVYVDGVVLGEDKSIGFQSGRQTMSLTVEDLAAGKHTIQVTAVDRAGNESYMSTPVTVYVDADMPTVSITTPQYAGVTMGAKPTLSAMAADGCGIMEVSFMCDGTNLGTVVPAALATQFTANKNVDLSSFASGTHTLQVTARDVAGRTVTAYRVFVLDKTAPSVSSLSGAPTPFYPRKRDGYRDNFKVKFYTGEACTAKLSLVNSSGKTVRTVTKKVVRGTSALYWNGKQSDGVVRQGTFKWRLTLTDAAGNTVTTAARKVSIKFYQVVRVSSSSVKVVAR